MKVAIIISTYNWPAALELSLASIAAQSCIPDEVIIGDDGSREETREVIMRWSNKLNIIHESQEDKGFRLARSRNIALRKVTSDYVICIDGDMILHQEFIHDHVHFARKGCFVQGSRVLLDEIYSKKILMNPQTWKWHNDEIRNGVLGNKKNMIRNSALSWLIGFCKEHTAKNTRTCNMAFWREDLYAVNGFDNSYEGWGREDSDLAFRLINYGCKRRKLKFAAVGLHIYHEEQERDSLPENDALLKRVLADKSYYRCKNGIEEK